MVPTARRLTATLLLAWVIISGMAGCKTAPYKVANMPAYLHVPPATPANGLNLAGMTSPGLGTSLISPGDLLELTIVSGHGGDEIVPFNVRVSPEGQVPVPLIGPVQVAGLEPFAAEQQIAAAALERQIYRQASVTLKVVDPAVNRITVLGAVTNPGVQELPRGSSDLANAIAAAGGLTEEAGTMVDVLHQESTNVLTANNDASPPPGGTIDLASYERVSGSPQGVNGFAPPPLPGVTDGPRTVRLDLARSESVHETHHALGDRDVVMVLPEEKQFIHVTGLVMKADQFEMPKHQDVRLLDAIALAGGVSSPVADKAYVIRRLPNMSQPAVIQVSLQQAKRNGADNLRLAAGDLVSVETTVATMFVDTVSNIFRMSLGVGGNLVTF
jgi:polysaccharide export outer membrane protein